MRVEEVAPAFVAPFLPKGVPSLDSLHLASQQMVPRPQKFFHFHRHLSSPQFFSTPSTSRRTGITSPASAHYQDSHILKLINTIFNLYTSIILTFCGKPLLFE
jgi:hypothetical protein